MASENLLQFLSYFNLSDLDLQNELQSSSEKLKSIIENSTLPNYINQIMPSSNNFQTKYFTEDDFNASVSILNTKFSVFHLNIRSLNSHHGFDCVCLSEIWNYNLDFLQNLLPDYTPYFDKVTDTNIGGVAIFVKNTYLVSERKDLRITNSESVKTENIWLEITNTRREKTIISVIYRHPKVMSIIFQKNWNNHLSILAKNKSICHKIITGDFNIDLITFEFHTSTGDYLEMLMQNGFLPDSLIPNQSY